MNPRPVNCERCCEPVSGNYSTRLVNATEQYIEVAPDGTAMMATIAGTAACSWNCLAILAATKAGSLADGAVAIVAERERQRLVEGYTPEHDDEHAQGELAQAAACYLLQHTVGPPPEAYAPYDVDGAISPSRWPWDAEWWKPKGERRDLVRAGALIAAELDAHARADRAGRAAAYTDEPF